MLNFFVFGSSIAISKGEKSDTLREPDQALSARDNADSSHDFLNQPLTSSLSTDLTPGVGDFVNQPLPEEAQSLSTNNLLPSIPSTGTLLAQNAYSNEIPGGNAAAEWTLGAAAAAFALFLERSQDVSRQLQDNPSNLKIPYTNPLVQSPTKDGQTQEGVTSNPAGATSAAATKTATGSWCPPETFGIRNLAWCDWGQAQSIVFTPAKNIISVWGYACTLFSHSSSQSLSPPPSLFLSRYEC